MCSMGRAPSPGAGLQRLQAAERIWPDQTGRGAGRQQHPGKIFHCPYCLGVWPEWQKLY